MKRRLLLAMGCTIFLLPSFAQAGIEWELISHEEGTKVWQPPIGDTGLVRFRGEAMLAANFRHVIAMLLFSGKRTEWIENITADELIEDMGACTSRAWGSTASVA